MCLQITWHRAAVQLFAAANAVAGEGQSIQAFYADLALADFARAESPFADALQSGRDLFELPTVSGLSAEIERRLLASLQAMTDEEAERLLA